MPLLTTTLRGKVLFFWLASILLTLLLAALLFVLLLERYRGDLAEQALQTSGDQVAAQLEGMRQEGLAVTRLLAANRDIVSRMSLIDRYRDPQAYQPLIFDPEKQALAGLLRQQVGLGSHYLMLLTDSEGRTVAFYRRGAEGESLLGVAGWSGTGEPTLQQAIDGQMWQPGGAPAELEALVDQLPLASSGAVTYHNLGGRPAQVSRVAIERRRVTGAVEQVGTLAIATFLDRGVADLGTTTHDVELSLWSDQADLLPIGPPLPSAMSERLGRVHDYPARLQLREGERAWAAIGLALVPGGGLWLVFSQPVGVAEEERQVLVISVLAVLFVVALTMLPLAWWLERRTLSRPVERLIAAVETMRAGGTPVTTTYRSQDELGRLARAFDEMAAAIGERELSLQQAVARLDDNAREMARLAEVMAHHLQEPSRRLLIYVQRLEKGLAGLQTDDEIELSLSMIEQQARRMRALIGDIHTYLAANEAQARVRPTDPQPILAQVRGELASELAQARAELVCDPLPALLIDAPRLHDIFFILIENALRYRAVERDLKVAIRVTQQGLGRVTLCVADNGIGVAPEYRERVLQLFERLHPHNQPDETGIGLPTVVRMVTHLGGRVWLEDSPLGGVAVCLTLPDATGEATP